ncbi:NAD-dependent epimerase/dehydratase family protein [Paenibacillus cremeus]|uniref:NAD-dependent epimerase/dehydratase family protein n=1 Tax=Paenibacillus cremeus TaxID=2163881 RepID=UPI0016458D18|nr:NAD-dependent epimerase/dehydratase family protein [Paenibacillus cremeus]
MKIVVTGGLGFIGSHVVDRYVALGHEVVVIDNLSTGSLLNMNPEARLTVMDLLDDELEAWLCREKPDLLNHHAAQVNVRASVADPALDLRINLLGTARLLHAAGHAGVKRVLFSSSGGTVYGHTPSMAIPETYHGMPISPYGIHKLACEQYVDFYSRVFGYEWVILRYANVYGPRQNPHGESGVISIFMERLRQGLPPRVNGDGTQVRDYVHVSDVAEANMLLSAPGAPSRDVYNVGTGHGTTLLQLLELLSKHFPNAPAPVFGSPQLGDLSWNVLRTDKLKAQGWKPMVGLEKGLYELA